MNEAPPKDHRLRKAERLRSKKQIDQLFGNGQAIKSFPFIGVWSKTLEPLPFPAQMAISVAKKRMKRAVDRNLIKRRVKEAYRFEKQTLYKSLSDKQLNIHLMFIFTGKEIPSFDTVHKEIKRIIKRLNETLA